MMRILTVCHYHPDIKISGSGLSARMISNELELTFGVDAIFLGGRPPSNEPNPPISLFKDSSNFVIGIPSKNFGRTHLDMAILLKSFENFLEKLSPDIVHFHSIHTIGLELLKAIPQLKNKKIKTVFTLHNYVPICMNNGWLIKSNNHSLCRKPSVSECQSCFPLVSKEEIELHQVLAKSLVGSVDALITPSYFARQKYEEWGIDQKLIHVISNGQKNRKNYLEGRTINLDNSNSVTLDKLEYIRVYIHYLQPF
jgi:hypothetical protein